MALLTPAAVLSIAMQCLPPTLAPIAAGIAQHENPRLDTLAINYNSNGTRDYGLAQINSANFGWLGHVLHRSEGAPAALTPAEVLEPCTNLKAAMAVLFARYNGNGSDRQKSTYAAGAIASVAKVSPVDFPSAAPIATPAEPGARPTTNADPAPEASVYARPAHSGHELVFSTR